MSLVAFPTLVKWGKMKLFFVTLRVPIVCNFKKWVPVLKILGAHWFSKFCGLVTFADFFAILNTQPLYNTRTQGWWTFSARVHSAWVENTIGHHNKYSVPQASSIFASRPYKHGIRWREYSNSRSLVLWIVRLMRSLAPVQVCHKLPPPVPSAPPILQTE